MPVRFRCHHCHQLLGIARRKIGMEVHCPTCHNPVRVPATDAPDVDQPAVRKPDPLFEGSDLDALLQPSVVDPTAGAPPQVKPPPAAVWPAPASPAVDVEPYNPPGPAPAAAPAAVVLSSLQATLLAVGAVLLLAVFFTMGLLIGRFWF